MNDNMDYIVVLAYATKNSLKKTIGDTVQAMTKRFKLDDSDARLLEMCLIEIEVGISAIGHSEPRGLSASEALALYKEAVQSDGHATLLREDSCDVTLAEEVLGRYITERMNY